MANHQPQVDWGGTLTVPIFYGREGELALLAQWVLQEHCRVISVVGMGGIGKSALVMSITHQLLAHFDLVIFRSLHNAPSCVSLLDDLLVGAGLVPIYDAPVEDPTSLEQRVALLLSLLRRVRVLMVLDNLEGLLEPGDIKGHFRPGFEGYEHLIQQIAETGHQSCLLLTSREKPASLRPLTSRYSSVRLLRLTGLDLPACKQLLEEKDLVGTEENVASLIEVYAGNPLALKIVAETIVDLFSGEIAPFLASGMVIFGSITDLLDEQFARLSALEQNVLCWLAIMREPVTIDELQALLFIFRPRVQIFEAVDSGHRHSLIERGKRSGSFTLQPVVLEYVTQILITEASREIQQHRLDKLIQYSLEGAVACECVRQMQERLLLSPLLTELCSAAYPKRTNLAGRAQGTASVAPVEAQLLSLLNELRGYTYDAQGYGPANLIALLRQQRGHLSGLDLSQLSLRGAYLQGIQMQDASLAGAQIRNCVWTSAVDVTRAVAISPDGKLQAAGGLQGKVHIWHKENQPPTLVWSAHTNSVQTLVFSLHGQALASAGADGTIKLWNSHNATLLWIGWQEGIQSLTFSPDGSLLASAGLDETVRLWDIRSHGASPRGGDYSPGTNVQTLPHLSAVFAVAFSPDGNWLASGCVDGTIHLWVKQKTEPATYIQYCSVQTRPVTSLAFAPDGRTLASANGDQTVKLWHVAGLRLLHTLSGHMDKVNCLAWSPSGHILASGSTDKGILLWDIAQGSQRAALLGHTSDVHTLAFMPDINFLLSGGADNTLRMWDVESGRCMHVIQGYGVSHYDIDWSPDGMQLVSGSTDGLVTIWNRHGETSPQVLYSHNGVLSGVRWSTNGRYLASCGTLIRLWDLTTGTGIQMDPSAILECIAWSQDGSLLACGTRLQGIQVWDTTTHSLRWADCTYPITFTSIAWSPDGTQLASAGSDGSVYLWEATNGTLLHKLQGHQNRTTSVAWSPDGTHLTSGGQELLIWDISTRRSGQGKATIPTPLSMQTIALHSHLITAITWNPHGDPLITGSNDGILRWWNIQNRTCSRMHDAHQGTIHSLRVSPDGRQLATSGADGAIRIWELESCELLQTLRNDRPYERLNITDIEGLTETQKASLKALGAIDNMTPKENVNEDFIQ